MHNKSPIASDESIFRDLDQTVEVLKGLGWKTDTKSKSSKKEITLFKDGILIPIMDFSYFLETYGMIFLYKKLSSHTMPLKVGKRVDYSNTIQGAIDFCNTYSKWQEELIPFYADKEGNYFCFNLRKNINEKGFLVSYLHDTREFHETSVGNSFLSFLKFATKHIPDCQSIIDYP